MKKLASIFAIAFLMTLGFNAVAQNNASAEAEASATIILPISIENNSDLLFGTIAKTTAGGTITIVPDAVLDIDYSDTEMETTLSERGAANFTIEGESGSIFSIEIPEVITLSSGSNSMDIETDINLDEAGNVLTGGSIELYVGGTLTVNGDQAVGFYQGDFEVTVRYE